MVELLSLEIDKAENYKLFNYTNTLTDFVDEDITTQVDTINKNFVVITYSIKNITEKKRCLEQIYSKLSNAIKEYLLDVSFSYFDENYFYFDETECDDIKYSIQDEIENDVKISLIIKNKLKEFLEENNSININGFVKFRLKFIIAYAEQLVEKCIDNHLIKKEYYDFINILKYFSETNNDKDYVLNIIYKNEKLNIYDENMKKVNFITNVVFAGNIQPTEIVYDESIINVLLTLSPKKIIIHLSNMKDNIDEMNKNTIEIINKLFNDRVQFCNGCSYCE